MAEEIINLINGYGLPVGLMLWMMTIGQKTLNDIVCNMKAMVDSNAKIVESNSNLKEQIKDMTNEFRRASDEETRKILEWMVDNKNK